MFCPVCKYEFRRGFTHCSTCDADLVDALPAEEEPSHQPRTPGAELASPALLWRGANGGTFNEIRVALDACDIPYNREDLDARLLYSNEYTELEVWVSQENLPAAQEILNEVLEGPPALHPALQPTTDVSDELTEDDAQDEDADTSSEPRSSFTRELYPEDATAEVWSGPDASMAEILKSCLAEIGVASCVERPGADSQSHGDSRSATSEGIFAVRVLPEDEDRAAEIVRQVVDGAPPQ